HHTPAPGQPGPEVVPGGAGEAVFLPQVHVAPVHPPDDAGLLVADAVDLAGPRVDVGEAVAGLGVLVGAGRLQVDLVDALAAGVGQREVGGVRARDGGLGRASTSARAAWPSLARYSSGRSHSSIWSSNTRVSPVSVDMAGFITLC